MSYNPVPKLTNGNATFDNDLNVSGISTFDAGIKTPLNTAADGATVTFDMDVSNNHSVTLGGNRALAVSNVDAGQKFTLRLKQDGTGSRAVTWWSGITWFTSAGAAPTLKTDPNTVDYIGFICTSGGYYEGFHLTENSSGGGGGGSSITVRESDGTPNVSNVSTIIVSNGTLTDDGSGQVTISTGGGGGGGSYDDTYVSGVSTFASGLAIQNQTDIATVSGLLYDDAAISGYFESRVDSADSSITANSGYFESRVDTNAADIITVSGLTGGGSSLTVQDVDGSPSVSNVTTIRVTNGSLTDNGGGTVTIATSGGGGGGGGTTYTAGSGLSLVGTEFNVYGGSGNFRYAELTASDEVPTFKYLGSGVTDTPINLEVRSSLQSATGSGTALLFQGTQGQLFSITDNLSSGTIFNVSDITGLPMLEITASGDVEIGEFADTITVHQPILLSGGVPTDTTNKLYNDAGTLKFNGSAIGGGSGGGGGGSGLPYSSGDYYLNSINTVSGLIPPNTFNITAGDGTNYTIDGMGLNSASDPTMYIHKGHTYVFNKTFSGHPFAVSATDGGSVYSDADGNAIEIGSSAGSVTFEVPQDAPDKLYYYCTAHPSTMKGVIYTTTDGATSGYFETRVDQNAADIITVSGLTGGGGGGGSYTAGSGLTLVGSEFNVYGGSGNFENIDLTTDAAVVPKMVFTGSGVTDTPIRMKVLSSHASASTSGTALAFEGTEGQLFGITDNLSSGRIFSVNDITGLPLISVDASGDVELAEFGRDIIAHKAITLQSGIPSVTTNKLYNDGYGLYFNGSAVGGGGSSYTAGSGLTLVGTEFNTQGDAGFGSILSSGQLVFDTSDTKIKIIGSNAGGQDGIEIGGGAFAGNTSVSIGPVAGSGTDDSEGMVGCVNIGEQAGLQAAPQYGTYVQGWINIGYFAGIRAYGLSNSVIIGQAAGWEATGCVSSTMIGDGAGFWVKDFDYSLAIGNGAGYQASGNFNTYLGGVAGYQVTGVQNLEIINHGTQTGVIGTNDNKINIVKTIVGDHSSKKLAIGNVGSADINPDATLEILPNAATDTGLIVQGATSQSATLQEWQNSSETKLLAVGPDGGVELPNNVPSTTTNKLYNDAGTLKFNGSAVGGGGSSYTAGSGLTLVGTEFNVHGGSGHFINLDVEGAFTATTKSFLIDHPSKEGMRLQYASLEGPENGVYVRGTTDKGFITLPDYWRDLVHNGSITVTLTPVGQFQPLFVEQKNNREIRVGGVCGYYDYVVYGERKDVDKLEVEW